MVSSIAAPAAGGLLSRADVAAVRGHPGFLAAARAYTVADLARYRALGVVERWMVSDMGRASLSGAVLALHALGRLTPATLMVSRPVATGEVSRGRARLYLRRAVANGLIAAAGPGDPLSGATPLAPTARFGAVMGDMLRLVLEAAAAVCADMAPALGRIAEPAFLRGVAGRVGQIIASRPEFFPLDGPAQLFQSRDGGMRLLGELIARRAPGGGRLLEACVCSHSALARASCCSRAHVIALLQDGQARGLLRLEGRRVAAAPELSEDVEAWFAGMFAVARLAATGAAAAG
jgi:hypothetical protein